MASLSRVWDRSAEFDRQPGKLNKCRKSIANRRLDWLKVIESEIPILVIIVSGLKSCDDSLGRRPVANLTPDGTL